MQPGDPARSLAGQFADEETLQNIRVDLGLDQPIWKQYFLYLNDLSPLSVYAVNEQSSWVKDKPQDYTGVAFFEGTSYKWVLKWPNLRRSYQTGRLVTNVIISSFPNTFILAISAMLFAVIIGLLLGVYLSLKAGQWQDQLLLVLSAVGMSTPSFFMAIIIAWLGGHLWSDVIHFPIGFFLSLVLVLVGVYGWKQKKKKAILWISIFIAIDIVVFQLLGSTWYVDLPGTGLPLTGSLISIDPFEGEVYTWSHLILPMLTLGIRPLAVMVQLMRNALLEEYQKDYMRTAKSKGLSVRYQVFKHALPNALNPVITAMSGWFASMLAGAVFIEFIFGWRGLGLEIYEALEREDLPLVMGIVLLFAVVFVVINVLVDLSYPLLDPRMRKQKI